MHNSLVRRFDCSSGFADVAPARRFVGDALSGLVDPAVRSDLQLVVSELMTNAIEHSATPHVIVEVLVDDHEVVLTVTSQGPTPLAPVDSWHWAAPDAPAGRGLAIVRELASRVEMDHVGEQLSVRVHRSRWVDPR